MMFQRAMPPVKAQRAKSPQTLDLSFQTWWHRLQR